MKSLTETNSDYICDIQAPCFQLLNAEEIEIIRSNKAQVLYRKGESLTKQGTFTSSVLFVISGLVKQYVEGDETHNLNLRIISSGEFIGLSSVFTKNTFNYSTSALTETHAFIIEKEAVTRVVQQNAQFGFNLIKRYSEHNSLLYETISRLMYKQMNGRLADALLYLKSSQFASMNVFSNLTRKDLAEFAGLSTENVVKLLKIYEKEGILTLEGKDINILNKNALIEISKKG